MAGWCRARRWSGLAPLLVAVILVMAAAGCHDDPSASATPQVRGLAAARATPATFRNLGKRGESAF